MKVELRYSDNPIATWDTFVRESGDQVKAYYRGTLPRAGEEVWDVLVDGCLAGWGSLIASAIDEHPTLCVGILPAYAGHGIRQLVKMRLVGEARKYNAKGVKTAVLLNNTKHLQRVIKESIDGSPFKFAGIITLPEPGYAQFVWTF